MTTNNLTIAQTITEIRGALQDYIEATYHIGHPELVAQRRVLLEDEGVLFRAPYIESTPRYTVSRRFADLDLPAPAKLLFDAMAHPPEGQSPLLYDPPYTHQATALEATTRDGMSLVVTTGTGSGKTESFLLPILAKLATEAEGYPASFATPALRALLLYPMNALVNDQLGRLRLLLGDHRVATQFTAWAGRPARFARYTSRTLYPGVRTTKKDQVRLRSLERFYISLLEQAADPESSQHERARTLIANLQSRGKWPAKPDLRRWFGESGKRWQDRRGDFVRAVLRPEDPELLTRHEVLGNPPDILITNYSMLEYMLMRPLERPIFDATREWLANNPDEGLLLVVDEAHLYRGAAGAEVGLLLRRLRARLDIPAERLQVICTSASFNDQDYARHFAAQLAGKAPDEFRTVQGELAPRPGEATGSEPDAQALADIPLNRFYEASDEAGRRDAIREFLAYRGTDASLHEAGPALYQALGAFPPMSLLVNLTMREAMPLEELGRQIFATENRELADRAVTALIALGSAARRLEGEPGLLPCRIHAFFRGLSGLWACVDPECSAQAEEHRASPVGALYSQPRAACACGARVFELYTCRNCGSAYARAYTDNLQQPSFLWHEPGGGFLSVTGRVLELFPLDLLLEEPSGPVEPAELDLTTGRLNPVAMGDRMRQVFLRLDRSGGANNETDDESGGSDATGEFNPCGVCGRAAGYGRSSVQDHQTKGDQPFQALVARQIEVQPPGEQSYSDFAPLRGRKVLAFSDSRQTAARLAPNLQTYSMQDVLRPLILRGWQELNRVDMLAPSLSLEDLYLAVLVASRLLSVRLRPELRGTESLQAMREVAAALERDALHDPAELLQLLTVRSEPPPQSLLRGMVTTITDRYYGLQSLGLASLRERRNLEARLVELPPIPGVAATDQDKLDLARLWLSQWASPTAGIWFQNMNTSWWQTTRGVRPHSGKFSAMNRWTAEREAKRIFEREWIPSLLGVFCELRAPNKYRIRAATLALDLSLDWGYCQACRTTQRPFPAATQCVNCGRDRVVRIDPNTDPVFAARKGYYRASSMRALSDPPEAPMAIIAAEHTAQLNAAQADEVFSKAEEHELLFQDVDLGIPTPGEQPRAAIDVLSCTTTMEVGIDIGTLSGVALRNMPPSRASYQQRAGRAGRRGNAVATVVAFGSADSHDEHYFAEPDAMIRGSVNDPVLTLDNAEIARRHVTAFLFQRYHQARLPEIDPEVQPQLFEVLGTVDGFVGSTSPLNRTDFEAWLRDNETHLVGEVRDWLPHELSVTARDKLLADLVYDTLTAVDRAVGNVAAAHEDASSASTVDADEDDATVVEAPAEEGEERGTARRVVENLLDRLLYKGVLPRYAFPTDVVSFYVFDRERSTRFRPEYRYAPSQGLPIALTQYAPGKEIWIDGKLWTSGALYSPMSDDRYRAWQERQLYFECLVCHYARTTTYAEAERGERRDCPACGSEATFGAAKNWIRPPGFAHPQSREEGTSMDDQPARSYATRAKLVAPGPADADSWEPVTPRIRQYYDRTHLLVTNTGPRGEGYTYCTRCGLIEPTSVPTGTVVGAHPKPFPDDREPNCQGSASTRGLVLGTDFISDVLLVSLRVEAPLTLRPGFLATEVALRTLSEAITIAATHRLEIEPGEMQAEYRPALTQGGHEGLEAEIYIYDTLAGGAGFARRIGELGQAVFEETIRLLERCPADCDRSCYRCLRSFKNRFEHDLLDRHLGASLLRYLVRGEEPTLDKARVEQAADRLYEDLSRHGLAGVELQRNARIDVVGIGTFEAPILAHLNQRDFIIGIHGPLTPDHATDEKLRDAKEYGSVIPVILIDEIVISRNLPHASRQVIEAIS
jgi:ATP-dependent helicase YprA (DUF1998 family)